MLDRLLKNQFLVFKAFRQMAVFIDSDIYHRDGPYMFAGFLISGMRRS
jgi:hypothetical protein